MKILITHLTRMHTLAFALEKASATAANKDEHHVTRKAAMTRKIDLSKELSGVHDAMKRVIETIPTHTSSGIERSSFELAVALRKGTARPERIISTHLHKMLGVKQ